MIYWRSECCSNDCQVGQAARTSIGNFHSRLPLRPQRSSRNNSQSGEEFFHRTNEWNVERCLAPAWIIRPARGNLTGDIGFGESGDDDARQVGCGGEVRRKYFLEKGKAVGGGFEVARDLVKRRKKTTRACSGKGKKKKYVLLTFSRCPRCFHPPPIGSSRRSGPLPGRKSRSGVPAACRPG